MTQEHTEPEVTITPGVTIKIVDSAGNTTMSFPASKTRSISEDAAAAGYEIPVACGAGACFFCGGRVKKGLECIDIGKVSVPLIDLEEDQVLTCIGGIHTHMFDDGLHHEVIIEKDI